MRRPPACRPHHAGPDRGHHRWQLGGGQGHGRGAGHGRCRHRDHRPPARSAGGRPWPTSAGLSGSDQVDLVVFDLADLASVRRGAEQILDRCPPDRRPGQQRRAGPVGAHRDGGRVRGHLRHQPPGSVPAHPAADRPTGRVGPGPGGQRGLDGPPGGPPRSGLRRPAVHAALPGHAGLQPVQAGQHPVHRGAGPTTVRDRGHGQLASTPGTVATGFARDDDAKGFLAFGVKVIRPFILTPETGRPDLGLPGHLPGGGRRHRSVLRQVPAPHALARRPSDQAAATPPVVGQRGAGRTGPSPDPPEAPPPRLRLPRRWPRPPITGDRS